MATKKPMTENARKVLNLLQSAGVGVKFNTHQVMDELGFDKTGSVTGSVTGLVNKGYAERAKEEVQDAEGKTKTISVFWLTEAGMAFDPDAEVDE